jgi:hypothetical protein
MFPQLKDRIGTALDIVVEFSTLGEYRLVADGAQAPASALAAVSEGEPQMGGAGRSAVRAAVRRTVAGGAAGKPPVATPAARRVGSRASAGPKRPARSAAQGSLCQGQRRHSLSVPSPERKPRARGGVAPEQLCLAV